MNYVSMLIISVCEIPGKIRCPQQDCFLDHNLPSEGIPGFPVNKYVEQLLKDRCVITPNGKTTVAAWMKWKTSLLYNGCNSIIPTRGDVCISGKVYNKEDKTYLRQTDYLKR